MLTILQGDAIEQLRTLPSDSVHCCVTSPPYWGLRDYGTAQWEGGEDGCDHIEKSTRGDAGRPTCSPRPCIEGKPNETKQQFAHECGKCGAKRIDSQLGLEKTPEEYVAKIVQVFREVRRVLRKDGTLWLNLGDSYASDIKGQNNNGEGGSTLTSGARPHVRAAYNDGRGRTARKVETGLKTKDLCGIPWRVAFALQQPYYGGRIKSEIDRAWLAALVDGEGCITILEAKSPHGSGSSYPPVLQVRMCDRECIDKVMLLVGSDGKNPEQSPPSQGGQRPSYHWRIHGDKACGVIAEIYPWILIKRKQAIIAWNHQVIRNSYETKRGVTIPTAALEKQMICRELIQRLNKRESVDIPSWMSEPPLPISPGWYLRSDCIWAKPNPMPESVTDRPTRAHEYLFLLTKSANYFYDAEAIREPVQEWNTPTGRENAAGIESQRAVEREKLGALSGGRGWKVAYNNPAGRNKRSVWTVATAPYPEAHFATYPPDLIKPCILAGTSAKGCCAKCGSPWERIVESNPPKDKSLWPTGWGNRGFSGEKHKGAHTHEFTESKTIGWAPTCKCKIDAEDYCGGVSLRIARDQEMVPCTVLDPFAGSGTTGAVALELGRKAILIELNPKYVALIEQRCAITPGLALA